METLLYSGDAAVGSLGVTGTMVLTLTRPLAARPVPAKWTLFTAVGPGPAGITAAATLCALPVLAAVRRATIQLAAAGTPPEVPGALAVPVHAGPMAVAVRWLAAGFVHTHHGGHLAGTAPHVVLAVI